jgi:CRP-like cAMP-binding protein
MGDEGEKANVLRIGLAQVKLSDFVEGDDLLRHSPLFKFISEREKQVLLRHAKVRTLRSGESLLEEGMPAKGLYFLLEGSIRLSMQGGMAEMVALSKGDIFGLSAVEPSAIRPQATADVDTRVALFPADQVQVLMQTTQQLGDFLRGLVAERRKMAEDGASFFDRW